MNFYQLLIEEDFPDIQMPERLSKFFGSDEHAKYSGKYCSNLPHYRNWPEVDFSNEGLAELFDEYQDCELENEDDRENFLPFASIEDSQFLAVKITNSKCPIYMWEHENGKFYKLASSLDEFLTNNLHDEEGENNSDEEE